MINWTLQEVLIKDLMKHPKNPRQINKDQVERLSQNMDKFGLIDKPIINRDNIIIGGHQRIAILKKKKIKTVQCWIPEFQLSEEDVDELCISLNLHQGKFDFDILGNLWEPLDLLRYGFSEEQLLGSCKEAEEVLGDEKPEKKKKTKECPNCGHEF